MVRHYFGFALCIAAAFVGTCSGQRGGVDRETAQPLIVSVLSKAGVSGSLEYWGRCDNVGSVPDYPRLNASRNDTSSPVETLREMFSDDPEMRVSQDANGTIRMRETDVPRDFLNITISHITFDGLTKIQYLSDGSEKNVPYVVQDPNDALHIILATPEVGAFMRSRNIRWPYPYDPAGSPIWRGEPQIMGNLDGVTLSQALDYVLKVYPGYWVYENCYNKNKERVVYVRFAFDASRAKRH